MRGDARKALAEQIAADARWLTEPTRRGNTTRPRITWILADLDDWADLGWPTGTSDVPVVAGGGSDPLPVRIALALADGDLTDTFAADRHELEDGLRTVAAQLGKMRAIAARDTALDPDEVRKLDRPTASCGIETADPQLKGCGRTVLRTAEDPLRRGLCTACYDRWWRAQRRDNSITAGHAPGATTDALQSARLDRAVLHGEVVP